MSGTAAPSPEPELVAGAENEAGWVKRLVCDLVDATILSTLRAGVAAHAGSATEFLAALLSDGGRNGDHPFQIFPGYVGSGPAVWLGHRFGMVPLVAVRFFADFATGWGYWLFCHKVNSGRTLGMATAGVRLSRAKDSSGRPRPLVRFPSTFLCFTPCLLYFTPNLLYVREGRG